MSDDVTDRLPEPYGIALLRGGPRAAVTVAVVALRLRGVVEAGRPGTLRRAATTDSSDSWDPLEKAVRAGLYRPAGIRELLDRTVVGHALARLRRDLIATGLLRSTLPGPTRAGRRQLAALRRLHPLPSDAAGVTLEGLLLAVALYGDQALTAFLPRFTEAAGLVGRGRDMRVDEGHHSAGGVTGLGGALRDEYESGGYGCGGGGGGGGD
ncbi:TIGR04222 domain-containing membrane protein [Streptomyces cupreus]|uniref:TIGR04222 domain-containing membrane protein n=1 Tax=Streptomyces cupreus TaxID=2759956 RepID=A0A7X1J114_9ACTN|nr:TIGR04222 domain-containing membrane protein [Streptomyces cupreus]MBC2902263.1 TIGR04222 domain-containing membrane protein [Streptomyces cupreus]